MSPGQMGIWFILMLVIAVMNALVFHSRHASRYSSGYSSHSSDGPRFGSTPELSTAAGFLHGTWVSSSAGQSMSAPPRLTFQTNGQYTLKVLDHLVHGVWVYDGQSVRLDARDVDGELPSEVERDYATYQSQSQYASTATQHADWSIRAVCLKQAQSLREIVLDRDQTRLDTVTQSQSMGGAETWDRSS